MENTFYPYRHIKTLVLIYKIIGELQPLCREFGEIDGGMNDENLPKVLHVEVKSPIAK